jgi:uncharacterized zinc-type alcohol dehydrogenase-like protein
MTIIQAWTAQGPKEKLILKEFDLGNLGPEEVEIAVTYCGICHSDLSILNNEWGISIYPCVPGHEIVGTIVALGDQTKGLKIGQTVGVGWNASCCLHCQQCLSGNQRLCARIQPTIVGHFGGFASRVRAQWPWVFPLPEGLDARAAGPLMCGGITVFNPFVTYDIKPTDRVGVVGIGGLGHLAIKFAKAWGCEVTAFTHSESKYEEAKQLGADEVISSVNKEAIKALNQRFDLLIVTVNVSLDWPAFIATVAPKGRMHFVGSVKDEVPISVRRDLISAQRSISGSPTGSPVMTAIMLEFAHRHRILPQIEEFPMHQVNEALSYVAAGKPRYRVVLRSDFDE